MADNPTIIETVFQSMVQHRPRLARFLESDGGEPVDVRELADQVVKGFPYPIGVELRRLFSSVNARPDRGRLDQCFKTIERTLQFTAFVMLSQLLETSENRARALAAPLFERLVKPAGLTMGDFAHLINAAGDCFRRSGLASFMNELTAVLDRDFYARLHFWTPERNEVGHYLINLDTAETERRCIEYGERLAAILAELAFLTRYHLVTMVEIRVEKTRGSPARFSHRMTPLSFLDPYTRDDRDLFFGREREVEEIHSRLLAAGLLLVYGVSGCGKTSLVQCGLANKFEPADCLAITVRRGTDILASLLSALEREALTPAPAGAPLDKRVRSLYLDHFKPVHLIFDQFEEVFIFGEHEERRAFAEAMVELTWLQVVMDRLYRQAADDAPASPALTRAGLAALGPLDNVLGRFLEGQLIALPNPLAGEAVLKAMVSGDGTRRPMTLAAIAAAATVRALSLGGDALQSLIQRLIADRILTDRDAHDCHELRHDSLAHKVRERMTAREKELLEVRQTIESRYRDYRRRGLLLDADTLAYLAVYEDGLLLPSEQAAFVKASRQAVMRRRRRQLIWAFAVLVLVLGAVSGLALVAVHKAQQAEAQKDRAEQPATAQRWYDEARAQVPDADAFEKGPVADFERFIAKGWQPEASRAALARMREAFARRIEAKPETPAPPLSPPSGDPQ